MQIWNLSLRPSFSVNGFARQSCVSCCVSCCAIHWVKNKAKRHSSTKKIKEEHSIICCDICQQGSIFSLSRASKCTRGRQVSLAIPLNYRYPYGELAWLSLNQYFISSKMRMTWVWAIITPPQVFNPKVSQLFFSFAGQRLWNKIQEKENYKY